MYIIPEVNADFKFNFCYNTQNKLHADFKVRGILSPSIDSCSLRFENRSFRKRFAMKATEFSIKFPGDKVLTFSSKTAGLIVNGKEYLALSDGKLIYAKTKGMKSNKVTCQLGTNTSTLIPSFRILGLKYHRYFDKKDVVESQNDITFYWNPSRLAAFYNRYSTDQLDYPKREPIIRKAVSFLLGTANAKEDFLPKEMPVRATKPVKLLGFYEGFPIFDNKHGFAKLLSRLGIHVDENEVMISTPLDEHAKSVENLAKRLEKKLKIKATYKKNRVVFATSTHLMKELSLTNLLHVQT